MKQLEEERQHWQRSTKNTAKRRKGWDVQCLKVMKQTVSLQSLLTPSHLIFFVHLLVVLSPSLSLHSYFSPFSLPVCSFTLGWKPNGWALIFPLQPGPASQTHRAILGNRIKEGKVQKYRRGVRQRVTARGRKHRKRDYEKEMECVGRSLTRHLMFFCR